MAQVLPSETVGSEDARATAAQLVQRMEQAVEVVPDLAPYADALREVYAEVASRTEPVAVQRVHGDFHLGQVLRTQDGWILLDFEGEPARPLAERTALMSPLRDVAGMLRSYDYAARHLLAERSSVGAAEPHLAYRAQEWGDRNRAAFCDGYAQAAGRDPARRGAPAAGVRARQGRVRGRVRGAQPALVALGADEQHRAAAPRGGRSYERGRAVTGPDETPPAPRKRSPRKKPDPVAAAEAIAPVVADEENTTSTARTRAPSGKRAAEATAPVVADESATAAGSSPSVEVLEELLGGAHHDPHSLLGAHVVGGRVVVRTLRPDAERVVVHVGDEQVPMTHLHGGVWEARLDAGEVPHYGLAVTYAGTTYPADDPYRYLPTLGEVDLHLIGEGRHEELWKVLGAHVRRYDTPGGEVTGTSFAVWAPSARGVRVMGDFNAWDGRAPPDALARLERRLGAVRAGVSRRRALQVPGARRRHGVAREGRPDGAPHRGAAADRERRRRVRLHVVDDAWMSSALSSPRTPAR
jgi:1,4-alpha-glucan branching enzyme